MRKTETHKLLLELRASFADAPEQQPVRDALNTLLHSDAAVERLTRLLNARRRLPKPH